MESDKQEFTKISKVKYAVGRGVAGFTKKTNDLVVKGVGRSAELAGNAAEVIRNGLRKISNKRYYPKHKLKPVAIQKSKYYKSLKRTISPVFIEEKEIRLRGIGAGQNKTIRRLAEFGKNLSRKEREMVVNGLVLSVLIIPMAVAPLFSNVAERINDTGGQKIIKAQTEQAMPSRGAQREPQNLAPPAPPAPAPAPAPAPEPAPAPPNLPPPLTNNTQNLNPDLLQRFDAFRTFIFQQYGVVLEIKSGWRSTEEQAELFRTLPRGQANPPGVSLHEKGLAIDYTPFGPTYNQHLPMFGLKLPFPGKENWHVEML